MPLNDRMRAVLRRYTDDYLISECVIQRRDATEDEYGNPGTAFLNVGTAICRVSPYQRQDNAGEVAGAEQGRSYFQLWLHYATDIRDGDQVVYSGDTYQVLQIHETHTDRTDIQAIIARLGT